MSELMPPYEPTPRFDNTNYLYGNHFRFMVMGLPDLSYFVQSVSVPSLSLSPVLRPNPFVEVKEVGDHVRHGDFNVTYLIDAKFQTYYSLYNWINGYGFPHSYEELGAFRDARATRIGHPHPQRKDLEKTLAVLHILQPDTEAILVEMKFIDCFPIAIGSLEFSTMDADAPIMKTSVTFQCTTIEVFPVAASE